MNGIISGSYWTQVYCEKEKLDYEEQNKSFFDLLQAAISAHCGEKIALYIHGDPVDSEFEEIELQDLMPIEKVIFDSEKVAPRSMLDFLWVNEVILGGNIRSIASGAFAQRRSPYIPRLKAVNVIDIETAFEGETGASEGCSSLNAPAPPEQQKPAIRCDCWFFLYLSMLCGAKNVADLR